VTRKVLKDYQHYVTVRPLEKEPPLTWTRDTVDHRLMDDERLSLIVIMLINCDTGYRHYGRNRWLKKVSWTSTANPQKRLRKIGGNLTPISGLPLEPHIGSREITYNNW